MLLPRIDESLRLVDGVDDSSLRIAREPELEENVVCLALRLHLYAVHTNHVIDECAEAPPSHELRVLLPQRAGGGIAGIGQRRQAGVLDLLVQLHEVARRDVDLAAYFQTLVLAVDLERQGAYGTDVDGDVVASDAVTAGGSARELAVFIEQVDRHAIN